MLHYLLPSWNYSAGSFKDLEVKQNENITISSFHLSVEKYFVCVCVCYLCFMNVPCATFSSSQKKNQNLSRMERDLKLAISHSLGHKIAGISV